VARNRRKGVSVNQRHKGLVHRKRGGTAKEYGGKSMQKKNIEEGGGIGSSPQTSSRLNHSLGEKGPRETKRNRAGRPHPIRLFLLEGGISTTAKRGTKKWDRKKLFC